MLDFRSYYDNFFASSKKIISHYLENNLLDLLDMEINQIFRTEVIKMQYNDFKHLDILQSLKDRNNSSPCDYIKHQLTVRSNGRATFCQFHNSTILDFKKYKFNIKKAIQNISNIEEDQVLMSEITYCNNCEYVLTCNSGCRSRAKLLANNIKELDSVGCFLHKKIYSDILPILPKNTQSIFKKLHNSNGLPPKYNDNDLKEFLKQHEFIF